VKRSEMHRRDPSQAVSGEANQRVRQALRHVPSLIRQSSHARILAADEVVHELAAERSDERFHLTKPLTKNARPAVGGARLRSGVAVHGDQRRADCDLKREFSPIALRTFRERL
jgi:hypothetical protein